MPYPHKNPPSDFIPYVFSHEEIEEIFKECDRLRIAGQYHSHTVLMALPSLIRLLYCTGLRINEALKIRNQDVHFDRHVIVVDSLKNHIQRFVPINTSLEIVLRQYISYRDRLSIPGITASDSYLFVSGTGKRIDSSTVSRWFHKIIINAGIPYVGNHDGPRVHDLRHTACVHTMVNMVRNGMDIYCTLPILATLMGHKNPMHTEYYLRLTQSMYPELISEFPNVISGIDMRRTETFNIIQE